MSEQAPSVDTPDPANPDAADPTAGTLGTPDQQQAPTEEQVNWQERFEQAQKRYDDLRPAYDRTAAEAAQYRKLVEALKSDDTEAAREAAEAFGLELADTDTEPVVYDDPLDELRAELDMTKREFKQFMESQKQTAAEQEREAQLDAIDKDARKQLADLSDLDDASRDWIYDRAVASHPPTPDGRVNIDAAYQEFKAFETARMQQWAKSKRAPHVSPVGTSATQAPNLDDDQARQDWMAQRLRDMDT